MLVKDVLNRKGHQVVTVGPDALVSTAVRALRVNRIGAVVVVDDGGQVVGLLSERDVVTALGLRGRNLVYLAVSDIMCRTVPVCRPDDPIMLVMRTMTEQRTRHVPVVSGGVLTGLVSIGDLVKARLDDVEVENRVLRDLARSRG